MRARLSRFLNELFDESDQGRREVEGKLSVVYWSRPIRRRKVWCTKDCVKKNCCCLCCPQSVALKIFCTQQAIGKLFGSFEVQIDLWGSDLCSHAQRPLSNKGSNTSLPGCITTEAIFPPSLLVVPRIKSGLPGLEHNHCCAAFVNYGCSHRVTACRWTRSPFESSLRGFVCRDNNHSLNHTKPINISLSTLLPERLFFFFFSPASSL